MAVVFRARPPAARARAVHWLSASAGCGVASVAALAAEARVRAHLALANQGQSVARIAGASAGAEGAPGPPGWWRRPFAQLGG